MRATQKQIKLKYLSFVYCLPPKITPRRSNTSNSTPTLIERHLFNLIQFYQFLSSHNNAQNNHSQNDLHLHSLELSKLYQVNSFSEFSSPNTISLFKEQSSVRIIRHDSISVARPPVPTHFLWLTPS
jgi:hypothetical protein